jgi:hypothetical protein
MNPNHHLGGDSASLYSILIKKINAKTEATIGRIMSNRQIKGSKNTTSKTATKTAPIFSLFTVPPKTKNGGTFGAPISFQLAAAFRLCDRTPGKVSHSRGYAA